MPRLWNFSPHINFCGWSYDVGVSVLYKFSFWGFSISKKRLGSNPRPMDLYFRKWMMTYLKIDIFFAIIFLKNLYTAIHFIRTTTEIYLRTEVSKLWNHCWYFHMYFFLNRLTNYRNFLKSYQKSSLVDHEIFFTRY